jgi:hypothetical protein
VEFPYLPVGSKGWHLTMGLRPLAEETWLEMDTRRDEELATKESLLATRRGDVVATRVAGDEASAELLEYVVAFLSRQHPEVSIEFDPDEHPLVAASRLVQEDLCILVREDTWRLVSACVCFPSRWTLSEKIGATLDEIHVPVPGYDRELATPTNAFFDRLRPERSFWRLNWTLLDAPELNQPSSARTHDSSVGEQLYLRVERQTLRQLARTKAIVFTIRTYVASLDELLSNHEDLGANLLLALDTAPDEMIRYKGWAGVSDAVRARQTST